MKGSGFWAKGSGFRVWDEVFRVLGAGFRVLGAGFRVWGKGFTFGLEHSNTQNTIRYTPMCAPLTPAPYGIYSGSHRMNHAVHAVHHAHSAAHEEHAHLYGCRFMVNRRV